MVAPALSLVPTVGGSAHHVSCTARPLTSAAVAVKRIDFTVRRQECLGFLGPNGAGKTSTMKMIYCRTPVTDGSLTVLGMDVRRSSRRIKHQIGVVTQDNDLDPDLTVRQNLSVSASFFGLSRQQAREKADELLIFVQLQDKAKQFVRELSGGIWFTPLYHVSHLARSFVLGKMSADLLGDVAWTVVFTTLALLFPARLIRRKLLV